ncbi:MAG: hypothetical protein KDG57_07155 [Rhodoferax sp.]|nr:hypothetical protein [Rhodoferax sp.]
MPCKAGGHKLKSRNQARFAFHRVGADKHLWALVSSGSSGSEHAIADPDLSAEDLGLTWNDVEQTAMATTMMHLYDYGALAIEDGTTESLDNVEGEAAWVTCLLHDLRRSTFLIKWNEAKAGRVVPAVERCLLIAETAHARLLLEGGKEGFFPTEYEIGYLTFRQLSLLSGMTEASLRTLASRASSGLVTERKGNNSYIPISHAKEWLKDRNRYTPIRRVSNAGAAPLTDRKHTSVDDFLVAIDERVSYLVDELGLEFLQRRLSGGRFGKVQKTRSGMHAIDVGAAQLLNRELMESLATVLELPPTKFALRAAEAVHGDELRRIERELQGVKQ